MDEVRDLNVLVAYKADLTIRKGSIDTQPRRGINRAFTIPAEGYTVFRAKVHSLINQQNVALDDDFPIYIKPLKTSVQTSFQIIDSETRQARELDRLREEFKQQEEHDEEQRNEDVVHIEILLCNQWIHLPVKLSSLRRALRLPQHDIFS
jgi:hypothetical protein